MDTQILKNLSLNELQETVETLREELEKLVNFVQAQENELANQVAHVKELEEKILRAEDSELGALKDNLAEQQEKAKMLEETLIGQYRNLHKREILFKQYLSYLLKKQGILNISEEGEQLDIKLILALLEKPGESQILEKSKTNFLPSKKLILFLIICGILLTGISLIYALKNKKIETAAPVTPVIVEPVKTAVTALGRIEPYSEVVAIAPPPSMGGAKLGQLLVKQGETVEIGQIIAILDDYDKKRANLKVAQEEIKVGQANLAIIKAGAKEGEIKAQLATINRLESQLNTEITAKQANINRLKAQLQRETQGQQATISRLEAELRNAETDFRRYQKLAEDGVITASELDHRQTNLETAQQRLKEAQANLQRLQDTLEQQIKEAIVLKEQSEDSLKAQIQEAKANLDRIQEVRKVDVAKAEAENQQLLANLQQQEADLELSMIKAPSSGRILKINAYPGEAIDNNKGIVELGQTDVMMVVAEVYESDITKVKIGQEATMTSESGAFDKEIKGTVREIGWQVGKKDVLSSDPAADVDVRVIEVKIKLDEKSSQLVSNLTYGKVIVKIFID